MPALRPSVIKRFRKVYEKGGHGGHDITHVERFDVWKKKVCRVVKGVDPDKYDAAEWLHNADRYKIFARRIKQIGIIEFCLECLEDSGFSDEAKMDIAVTVAEHSKFKDEPHDSPLLKAIRLADKLDRMCALGILAIGANALRPYDTAHPFGYATTVEGKMKTLYDNCFRVIEWYGMMPSDEARALVPKRNFRYLIGFVRQLGREMALATGIPNGSEADLKKALGEYYNRWR